MISSFRRTVPTDSLIDSKEMTNQLALQLNRTKTQITRPAYIKKEESNKLNDSENVQNYNKQKAALKKQMADLRAKINGTSRNNDPLNQEITETLSVKYEYLYQKLNELSEEFKNSRIAKAGKIEELKKIYIESPREHNGAHERINEVGNMVAPGFWKDRNMSPKSHRSAYFDTISEKAPAQQPTAKLSQEDLFFERVRNSKTTDILKDLKESMSPIEFKTLMSESYKLEAKGTKLFETSFRELMEDICYSYFSKDDTEFKTSAVILNKIQAAKEASEAKSNTR